jgi:20S proteasome alpha/beta subunit
MTVVCTDGETIAADSQETGNYLEYRKKIIKLEDGRWAGIAGSIDVGYKMIEFINKEIDSTEWNNTFSNEGDAEILIVGCDVYSDGEKKFGCWWMTSDTLVEVPVNLPAAVGSGSSFAMVALDLGHTPQEAVKAAIKRDPYCGGRVCVEKISQS